MGSVGTLTISSGYHEFSEVPIDEMNYPVRDGKVVEDYMATISNYRELIAEMSLDEKQAFYDWTEGVFMNGQQYLPDFWRQYKADGITENDDYIYERRLTRIYDKILDKSVVKEPITVVRIATPEFFGLSPYSVQSANDLTKLQALKGTQIECRGNLACAAAKEGLKIHADAKAKSVEYRISIPGNTKGAGMYIGTDDLSSFGNLQREFMMNRDVVYEIGDSHWDSRRGVAVVDVKYIGRKKHDYSWRY